MENHPPRRHTAWIVAAIIFDGLLICVVLYWVNTMNTGLRLSQPSTVATTSAISDDIDTPPTSTLSISPIVTTTPSVIASTGAMATATPSSFGVLPVLDFPQVLSITDQGKKVSWNEISFQYPGNWTVGEGRDARAGVAFSSTTKEVISMRCPIPEIGFEGWDFDHPVMKLEQNIPGTNNQYKKSLVIAQPVLQWGPDGKPVLDPKNKTGLGWISMLQVTKTNNTSQSAVYGCMMNAIYNHAPTGTEKQALQTMYNSVAIDTSVPGDSSMASIIRYINQSYAFSIDFPKSWSKIKEENLTTAYNKDNTKPYRAVLKLSPADAATKSGRHVVLYIYDKAALGSNPAEVDQQGVSYLGVNAYYGYYYSGSGCDAAMKDTEGCKTLDEVKATNAEITQLMKTFQLTKK